MIRFVLVTTCAMTAALAITGRALAEVEPISPVGRAGL